MNTVLKLAYESGESDALQDLGGIGLAGPAAFFGGALGDGLSGESKAYPFKAVGAGGAIGAGLSGALTAPDGDKVRTGLMTAGGSAAGGLSAHFLSKLINRRTPDGIPQMMGLVGGGVAGRSLAALTREGSQAPSEEQALILNHPELFIGPGNPEAQK